MNKEISEDVFDILHGYDLDGRTLYSIPMELMTPKLAKRLVNVPNAVFLAVTEKTIESYRGETYRYLFSFFGGVTAECRCTEEVFRSDNGGRCAIIFMPSTDQLVHDDCIIFDLKWMSPLDPDPCEGLVAYTGMGLPGDDGGMGDPSDQARDREQLDREIASFEATT